MRLFAGMAVSGSALTAERLRMDVIANNLANANSTRTAEGGPYRRQMAVLAPRAPQGATGVAAAPAGVRVVGVVHDSSPPRFTFDPGHPDADDAGMVAMPNVNPVTEMVDLISATRAYEANVTALNAFKSMAMKALEIGRG